jgi:DNA primase large subunit
VDLKDPPEAKGKARPRVPAAKKAWNGARKGVSVRIDIQPVCVTELVNRFATLKAHGAQQENFFLANWAIHAGWSDADILNVFKTCSRDFNDKISMYQIQHVRKMKYKLQACSTILALGLCPGDCREQKQEEN